CQQYNELPFTF
nr:immunoglobulin light chain junction region [Macaca mulatta]